MITHVIPCHDDGSECAPHDPNLPSFVAQCAAEPRDLQRQQ